MFLSKEIVISSIQRLANIHAFFGITFLTCKNNNLQIDSKIDFAMDTKTKDFMTFHHKICKESSYYFQPFTTKKEQWLVDTYPSSGLQSINTRTFSEAFNHDRNTRYWSWRSDYINFLLKKLKSKLPAFDLTVWLYKNHNFNRRYSQQELVENFFKDYNITKEEQRLFEINYYSNDNLELFQKEPLTWDDYAVFISSPPDAKPDADGILSYLETNGIGPVDNMQLIPGERLTIITGDNGLGKSFLLDCSWWALTANWVGLPAYPRQEHKRINVELIFSIKGKKRNTSREKIKFNWNTFDWPKSEDRTALPGLTIYVRVDGSFAVWDPARQNSLTPLSDKKYVFSYQEVWDGLQGNIEGLVRDWVRWQNNPQKYPFEIFKNVLSKLSPPDLGCIMPGEPQRIPYEPRDIPTITTAYGVTPIIYASAGVRRILTLAYLIVWAWDEHRKNAELKNVPPQRRMVILIDEIEAHLHPKWQREVLPAILNLKEILSEDLEIQFIITTHSPLVLASIESLFSESKDALYNLDLDKTNKVQLNKKEFILHGDISRWLTSPIFNMKYARSKIAEELIENAKKIQLSDNPKKNEVEKLTKDLLTNLAGDDQFWPRWIAFAEQFGIDI